MPLPVSLTTHTDPESHDTLPPATTPRPRRVLAAGRPRDWRGVDYITVCVVGMAFGLAMAGWNLTGYWAWLVLTSPFPPLQMLGLGVWLLPCVLGALLIRRPGAALLCIGLSAFVQLILGNPWGPGVLISALAQGLGAEAAVALLRWRHFTWPAAVFAGGMAATGDMIYHLQVFTASYDLTWKLVYVASGIASGALVGGLGAWLLIRKLAPTGAISAFPPGQEYVHCNLPTAIEGPGT